MNKIIPIAEGNYWIYGLPGAEEADTLHYEGYVDAGPDSLGNWFWVCWSSYDDDEPFILAKIKPEGYCMNWSFSSDERTGMYDLWGRKTADPSKAVNSMLSRDDEMEYILYKYPIELDEEWILFTQPFYNEDNEYVCDCFYKGRYDANVLVEVQAGEFSTITYQYFLEAPPEYLYINSLLDRSYFKPGIGENIFEYNYGTEEPVIWERIQELIDFCVDW